MGRAVPSDQCGDGAILTAERDCVGDGGDGRHFEEAGQGFSRAAVARDAPIHVFPAAPGELERDGRAAKAFFRVRASRLIRVQDGERQRGARRAHRASDGR